MSFIFTITAMDIAHCNNTTYENIEFRKENSPLKREKNITSTIKKELLINENIKHVKTC